MNCKHNCLAFYVGDVMKMRGQVFQCIELSEAGELIAGEPVWRVHPNHCLGHDLIRDSSLKPFRDPGEDAECESKAWLPPVPNSTKETVNG